MACKFLCDPLTPAVMLLWWFYKDMHAEHVWRKHAYSLCECPNELWDYVMYNLPAPSESFPYCQRSSLAPQQRRKPVPNEWQKGRSHLSLYLFNIFLWFFPIFECWFYFGMVMDGVFTARATTNSLRLQPRIFGRLQMFESSHQLCKFGRLHGTGHVLCQPPQDHTGQNGKPRPTNKTINPKVN